MQLSTIFYLVIPSNRLEVLNGSMQNGTVYEEEMLAAIRNRLYLCSAFDTQLQDIEY